MHPHEFRKTLLDYVDAYVKHDSDHESTEDKAEKKRIADRRRRAADGIARTCESVAATLATETEEGEAKASGGYRAAIVRARKALPVKAHRLLDGLPCDDVRAWNPDASYRCPKCELVGPAVDAFGARLEVMAFDDDANLARLRAWWVRPDEEGAQLADIQRKRIEAFQPYPHPTSKGLTYALAPFRQSNCNACRNEAAKRSAERAKEERCG
jgi:hypothetical protein